MATVRLDSVRKVFGSDVVVDDVSCEVRDGEFMVLVGPSGCGKSTTLRMIAGLESVTSGGLFIGDRLVNDVPPSERDIAMVFQSYALYPHMTVRENLAFALRLRRLPATEVTERVGRAAAMLGLEALLERRPRALSGGQRQRVAIGRAIVREPHVFLFDEPLSNLDAKMRVQMRREISSLQRRLGVTTIYVTHDQVEAMTMGDRIVVMNRGAVQQIDTPLGLYDRPRNLFVAGFIGSPAMNLVEGTLERGDAGAEFRSPDGSVRLPIGADVAEVPDGATGRRLVAGIRPEAIHRAPTQLPPGRFAPLTLPLAAVEPLGNETLVYAGAPGRELTARLVPQPLPALGTPVDLLVDLSRVHYFDGDSGTRIG